MKPISISAIKLDYEINQNLEPIQNLIENSLRIKIKEYNTPPDIQPNPQTEESRDSLSRNTKPNKFEGSGTYLYQFGGIGSNEVNLMALRE